MSSLTLAQALQEASTLWRVGSSSAQSRKVTELRGQVCCEIVGLSKRIPYLDKGDAIRLLEALQQRGLSKKSVKDYYATFRRVLRLSGRETPDWPRSPVPPRKTRDAMAQRDFERLVTRLHEKGYSETADVATLLEATGLRIAVEALRPGNLRVSPGADYDTLHVTGKGGHEREIPVVEARARAILQDPKRYLAMSSVPYGTHLARWNKVKLELGVISRLATPHSLRHKYACKVLDQSGGNLRMAQELLGHSSPGTTALYATTSTASKVAALTRRPLGAEDTSLSLHHRKD